MTEPATSRPAKGYGSTRTTPKKFRERVARKLREKSQNRNFTKYERQIYFFAAAVVDTCASGRPDPYEQAAASIAVPRPPAVNVVRFEISPEEFFYRLDARLAAETREHQAAGRTMVSLHRRAAAWLAFQSADAPGGRFTNNPDRDAMHILECLANGRELPARYRKHTNPSAPAIQFSEAHASQPATDKTNSLPRDVHTEKCAPRKFVVSGT